MATARAKVRVTAHFVSNLESIERFLLEQDAPQAYEALLRLVRETVVDQLERFPRIGRPFLARRGGSIEVLDRIARITKRFPDADLREYVLDDWLLLYLVQENPAPKRPSAVVVSLLSVRHQRQLSFDLQRFWPNEPG